MLDRILDSIGSADAGQIITFGDGPVEIRETHKRGGITVGLANNEQRRYGLNAHKRTRLIKAEVDIVIPDIPQMGELLELLGIHYAFPGKVFRLPAATRISSGCGTTLLFICLKTERSSGPSMYPPSACKKNLLLSTLLFK